MTAAHEKLTQASKRGDAKAETHLESLERAYGRALRAAGRRSARAFRTAAQPLLAAANEKWTPPPTDAILNKEALEADTEKKTRRLHRLMLTSAAQTALEPFGISFDITAPTSVALLDAVGKRIQDGIAAAIEEQIASAIRDGYTNGSSVTRVAAAIEKVTEEISRPRAAMLARTDLNALSNGGSLIAASVSDAAPFKVWIATEDERTRETHAEADGQVVPIDGVFTVGGEECQYPGDPDLDDSESCNCRCTLGYTDSMTASARPAKASPLDFASWADHAWEGDAGSRPSDVVTSGGIMTVTLDDALTAAASGDTGLPLSERDRAWDAGEATGRVKKWASSDGSGDPDKIDYDKLSRAYFWRDAAGSGGAEIGDFKLPFADIIGGKLTAVWRGVTSGAQRLSATQGIDKGAVQKKMAAYYRKAADTYSDSNIKAPWESGSAAADGEKLAAIRAHLADMGADILEDDELRAMILTFEALTFSPKVQPPMHAYQGAGGSPCEMCGLPLSAACHGLVASAELTDFVLTAADQGSTQWQATLCVEGEPTVDSGTKRLLAEGAITFLPLPLPLAIMDDSSHADVVMASPVCGRIDQIWKAGNKWQAAGIFMDASADPDVRAMGSRAAALVGEKMITGISVDLVDAEVEMMVYTPNGAEQITEPVAEESFDVPEGNVIEVADPEDLEYVLVFTSAKIAGATICPSQALTDATIAVVAGAEGKMSWLGETTWHLPSLTAAAAGLAPLEPPAEWFSEPEHDGPTPLTVTDDGQVYGHLALWGTCHTGKPGVCVTAPHSPSAYRNFHRGELKTAEGDRVSVGVLTMNTGHAGLRLNARETLAHYDDTGTVAAHVQASDGAYGIWLAGALNPKLSAEDARVLMAAPPSGDWRELNRGEGLDLFAALAVNVQGFPVPRPAARLVAAGDEMERVALVAAGRVEPWTRLDPKFLARFDRKLAVLAASLDGIDGLAQLVA